MFTAVRHFSRLWAHEAAQTARVFATLTDASLSQRVAEGHRTLGDLAWHVVVSPREIAAHAGLEFAGPTKRQPAPTRAAELHANYVDAAKTLGEAVDDAWTDDMLKAKVPFYGQEIPRGIVLATILHHEIHHRGQMTVLMRQAGLKVPGVYGPAG